jgi:hypothetical protein
VQINFPAVVYVLCFVTSGTCAFLLWRSYWKTRARLLLWSSASFVLLAANNFLLMVDLLVVTDVSLRAGRLLLSLAAVVVLIFGFVWDLEEDR